MSTSLSGLAASIRGAVDSETFDLAGKNASTIENAVKDAFAEPFPLDETIRLTFVTGAGKLARQKYDEGAPRVILSVLKELGYEEDHGGGPGTFKQQHDTGKNLKTVVVYPKVQGGGGGGSPEAATQALSLEGGGSASLLKEGSPEHKIAYTSMNVFERMIASMCPTWLQKKGCVAAIDDIEAMVKELDEKLLSGTPLSDAEQAFYDDVSITSLEEKQNLVRDMMHKQVEDGFITAAERNQLLSQVEERLDKLEKEKQEATQQNKPKRVETLTANIAKAKERHEMLQNTKPRLPPLLKKHAEINKLRLELVPLLELEASCKGRLLSLKESQDMARKEEIQAEIQALELASRGWFESDETFQARVEACRASFKAPVKKKAAAGGGGGSKTTTTNAWSSSAGPTARKKTATKSNSKGKGGVFAAMMMDSDSD